MIVHNTWIYHYPSSTGSSDTHVSFLDPTLGGSIVNTNCFAFFNEFDVSEHFKLHNVPSIVNVPVPLDTRTLDIDSIIFEDSTYVNVPKNTCVSL